MGNSLIFYPKSLVFSENSRNVCKRNILTTYYINGWMEIQLNDYHKKVNAQKMASMAYWREHPSLQSAGIVRHFQKHSSLFTGRA